MKTNAHLWCWRLLLLLSLLTSLSIITHAQVSFVQITDPHIFDDSYQTLDNRLDNKAALASCISKINQRVLDNGVTYHFVVVTGDLGIEQLLDQEDKTNNEAVDDRIRSGASDLASMLVLSKVGRWLFVPGNNDVPNEQPENVKFYHLFMEALADEVRKLRKDFEIIDLCPRDNSSAGYDSRSSVFRIKEKSTYAFIGFDNTSFKNADPYDGGSAVSNRAVKRIDANFDLQKRHVAQVKDLLRDVNITYAYIFYHIPEIDNPYLASLEDQQELIKTRNSNIELTGDSYARSAWFVKKEVRDHWNEVVTDARVAGLFAGHFHAGQRKTYQNFEWLRSPNKYLPQTLTKLHVCPPLALRLQNGSDEQARGFQEVFIDDRGIVSTRILWLEQAGWNLSREIAADEAASIQQFELGRVYESLGQLKDAEAAYRQASECNWQPTRERALASLREVIAKQNSWREKYLFAPLSAALNAGIPGIVTLLPAFVVVLIIYLWRWWRGKKNGRYQVRIGPIVNPPGGEAGPIFVQVSTMIHSSMRRHYKPRNLISGVPKLPIIATSQSEEVASLVESSVPGGLGKLLTLLIKRTDRPKYSIQGVVTFDVQRNNNRFFVSLLAEGETLNNWDVDADVDELILRYKELAYLTLRRLMMDMKR